MTTVDTGDIAALIETSRRYVTDVLTKQVWFPKPVLNLSRRTRRWDRLEVQAAIAKRHAR